MNKKQNIKRNKNDKSFSEKMKVNTKKVSYLLVNFH